MKKILAFGASTSSTSINKTLANYTANLIPGAAVTLLDLNNFEMPIYSVDREKEIGIPEKALLFRKLISEADGIIISFAEHNGSFSAAYKNIYDWTSRIAKSVWQDKPMLLLATSPGGRGGQLVLETATKLYSFANKNVIGTFSLPFFGKNFDTQKGILEEDLKKSFQIKLTEFTNAL